MCQRGWRQRLCGGGRHRRWESAAWSSSSCLESIESEYQVLHSNELSLVKDLADTTKDVTHQHGTAASSAINQAAYFLCLKLPGQSAVAAVAGGAVDRAALAAAEDAQAQAAQLLADVKRYKAKMKAWLPAFAIAGLDSRHGELRGFLAVPLSPAVAAPFGVSPDGADAFAAARNALGSQPSVIMPRCSHCGCQSLHLRKCAVCHVPAYCRLEE